MKNMNWCKNCQDLRYFEKRACDVCGEKEPWYEPVLDFLVGLLPKDKPTHYACEMCKNVYVNTQTEQQSWNAALKTWTARALNGGTVEVCDDCYRRLGFRVEKE